MLRVSTTTNVIVLILTPVLILQIEFHTNTPLATSVKRDLNFPTLSYQQRAQRNVTYFAWFPNPKLLLLPRKLSLYQ